MDLFHDYVRGGIEVMYEQFTDGCQTQDDYLSKTYEVKYAALINCARRNPESFWPTDVQAGR